MRTKINLLMISSFLILCGNLSKARADIASEFPLVRGPGVSQEQLEAYAEAQGRNTLSDQLDLQRPGKDNDQKLHKLVERAQVAWLSGSIESARSIFKEIAHQALEADWREPQREAIHYSFLRLAQSAPTATERDEWIEKAVTTFPDLQADTDNFPPPLLDAFRETRSRVLALAKSYSPAAHFPDHRYLLINGKKFVITSDLKIRLPKGIFRVSAYSDAYLPVTEKLTSTQMEVFRLSMPALAAGTCDQPMAGASNSNINSLTVIYSVDCSRSKNAQGWLPRETEFAKGSDIFKSPSTSFDQDRFSSAGTSATEAPSFSKKKALVWAGLTAIAAGTVYVLYEQMNHRDSNARTEPVHRTGF